MAGSLSFPTTPDDRAGGPALDLDPRDRAAEIDATSAPAGGDHLQRAVLRQPPRRGLVPAHVRADPRRPGPDRDAVVANRPACHSATSRLPAAHGRLGSSAPDRHRPRHGAGTRGRVRRGPVAWRTACTAGGGTCRGTGSHRGGGSRVRGAADHASADDGDGLGARRGGVPSGGCGIRGGRLLRPARGGRDGGDAYPRDGGRRAAVHVGGDPHDHRWGRAVGAESPAGPAAPARRPAGRCRRRAERQGRLPDSLRQHRRPQRARHDALVGDRVQVQRRSPRELHEQLPRLLVPGSVRPL